MVPDDYRCGEHGGSGKKRYAQRNDAEVFAFRHRHLVPYYQVLDRSKEDDYPPGDKEVPHRYTEIGHYLIAAYDKEQGYDECGTKRILQVLRPGLFLHVGGELYIYGKESKDVKGDKERDE